MSKHGVGAMYLKRSGKPEAPGARLLYATRCQIPQNITPFYILDNQSAASHGKRGEGAERAREQKRERDESDRREGRVI